MESSNLDHHHKNTSGSSSIPLIGGHEWNSGNLMLSNIDEFNLTTPMVEDLSLQWQYYNQQNHNLLGKCDHEPFTKENNEANDPFIINNKYLSSMKHYELPPSTTHENLNHPSTGESPLSAQISEEHGRRNIVFPTKKISANDEADFTCCAPPSMEFDGVGLLSGQGRFGRAFSEESLHDLNLARAIETFGMSCVQQPNTLKGNIDNGHKTPDSLLKRCNSDSDHRESMSTGKRSRAKSCRLGSPFKVRKEKLGDRISALQQLVAPFAKTDTASVLMEAIGYIKFLQHQVQTLSVPYMKSSTTTKNMIAQKGSSEEVVKEGKEDLRSRGLCLVPLSHTSCFTDDTASFWPL